MKTPITYYGGKQSMLHIILPLIPKHEIYVEPFLGGGAVFWAKEKSPVEVINDTNTQVVNFYRVAKVSYPALVKEIKATLHSRLQHTQAKVVYENPEMFSPIKRAWAFWVLSCQSFGASLGSGWRYGRSAKVESLIDGKRKRFTTEIVERLELTQIECTDAIRIIQSRDSENTFFYCDPPYFNANMGHYAGYSLDDFRRLLEALANIKGKFLLSSYPSTLLDEYCKKYHWTTFSIPKKIRILRGDTINKQEILTANYPLNIDMKSPSESN